MQKLKREDAKKLYNCPILLGGDIEFFAQKDGVVIPADSKSFFVGKDEYKSVYDRYHKVFADGVQIEINFPPYHCRESVVTGIVRAVIEARNIANIKGASLIAVSAVKLKKSVLDTGGKLSHIMGCNPDYSAYTDIPNPPIEDFATHPIRTAGYHIQFGIKINPEQEKEFARLCDRVIGTIAMWGDRDESHHMRKEDGIGLAGCYRNHPESSRFEYRTPGAFWIRQPALSHAILGVARMCGKLWLSGLSETIIAQMTDAEVRTAINNCDNNSCRRLAMRIIPFMADAASHTDVYNSLSGLYPAMLSNSYIPDNRFDKKLANPVHSLVWMLDGKIKFADSDIVKLYPSRYGWINYANYELRGNLEFLEWQEEFNEEIA